MTLGEVKDLVAQEHEWDDWDSIENSFMDSHEINAVHANLLDNVALKFAYIKLREAAERAQMKYHCGYTKTNTLRKHIQFGEDNVTVDKETITDTPLDR